MKVLSFKAFEIEIKTSLPQRTLTKHFFFKVMMLFLDLKEKLLLCFRFIIRKSGDVSLSRCRLKLKLKFNPNSKSGRKSTLNLVQVTKMKFFVTEKGAET
jgi:hypothetical protein